MGAQVSPEVGGYYLWPRTEYTDRMIKMVGPVGLEPTTKGL